MRRLLFVLSLFVFALPQCSIGQTAREVLDKCAASLSGKDGVQADFTMSSAQYGNASGKISVKGQKFSASTSVASMWFDGKTLWTYLAKNDEVSITTPDESRLQTLNPYNFINMYKQGFKYTMTKSDRTFNVHLTANDEKRNVREMFITVDKSTYHPTEVKILQKQKWTTFTISNLKTTSLSDDVFRFNSKDFPSAEVIDMR